MRHACRAKDENALEVDFGAFDVSTPCLTLPSSIGKGVNFVSKFMTSKFSGNTESATPLVEYLLALNHRGEVGQKVSRIYSICFNIRDIFFLSDLNWRYSFRFRL